MEKAARRRRWRDGSAGWSATTATAVGRVVEAARATYDRREQCIRQEHEGVDHGRAALETHFVKRRQRDDTSPPSPPRCRAAAGAQVQQGCQLPNLAKKWVKPRSDRWKVTNNPVPRAPSSY